MTFLSIEKIEIPILQVNWRYIYKVTQLEKNLPAMKETWFRFLAGLGSFPGERISYPLQYSWASLVAHTVKNLPAMGETWV